MPPEGAQSPIDAYVSYTGGRFINDNEGAYEGLSRNLTTGVDFTMGDSVLAGLAVGYEYSNLAFDNALDGEITKKGWRVDLYSGVRPGDMYSINGLLSYGRFSNDITANAETGSAASGRIYAMMQASSHFDVRDYTISPYLSFDYLREDIDGYTTAQGTSIAAIAAR